MDWRDQVQRPTLVVNRQRAEQNIKQMAEKAARSGVRFRPHFKTHQSAPVAEWFKHRGVQHITVSSVRMALYFAAHGWEDISIAFPVNLREIDDINDLAERVNLNLLLESSKVAFELAGKLHTAVGVFIKIDIGYGRTGVAWDRGDEVIDVVRAVQAADRLVFKGLLTHAGHTYHIHSKQARAEIFKQTAGRMQRLRAALIADGIVSSAKECIISVGDTPGATAVDSFSGVDEVRPGNFVYFDAQQYRLGSCREPELAAAVACPVVAVHPERNEIVLYGGAIHLSGQFELLSSEDNSSGRMYGYITTATSEGWGPIKPEQYISRVSQEHGVARVSAEMCRQVQPGDILCVIPVHSCLSVDLLDTAITTEGDLFALDL
jgi:D-serine deaminase-like pyridoxal phosphate-dependent protein